jgi:hypothetical protein
MPKGQPPSGFSATVISSVGTAVGSSSASAEGETLIRTIPPEVRAHFEMWGEILSETDRGAAILGAAYLDARLKDAIRIRFCNRGGTASDLLKPNGYLGQYSAKCQIAYCLGLYGKTTFSNLNIIGQIRNTFAHSKDVLRFTDHTIAKLCNGLKASAIPYFEISQASQPRNRYLHTVQCIGLILASEMTRDDQPKLLAPRYD